MDRSLRRLAVVVIGGLALTGCNSEEYLAVGTSPQVLVAKNADGGMEAGVSGRLRYLADHDCIVMETGALRAPVIWPEGSSAVMDEVGLVVDVGGFGPIRDGAFIEGGGGYLTPSPDQPLPEVADACITGGTYVFVQRILSTGF